MIRYEIKSTKIVAGVAYCLCLCFAMLYFAFSTLCYAMVCYGVLCCAMLCKTLPHIYTIYRQRCVCRGGDHNFQKAVCKNPSSIIPRHFFLLNSFASLLFSHSPYLSALLTNRGRNYMSTYLCTCVPVYLSRQIA